MFIPAAAGPAESVTRTLPLARSPAAARELTHCRHYQRADRVMEFRAPGLSAPLSRITVVYM